MLQQLQEMYIYIVESTTGKPTHHENVNCEYCKKEKPYIFTKQIKHEYYPTHLMCESCQNKRITTPITYKHIHYTNDQLPNTCAICLYAKEEQTRRKNVRIMYRKQREETKIPVEIEMELIKEMN